jgi:hypothetical protein
VGQCFFDYEKGVWSLSYGATLKSTFVAERLSSINELSFSVSFKTSSISENLFLFLYANEYNPLATQATGSSIASSYCGCGYSGGQPPVLATLTRPASCITNPTNVNEAWSSSLSYSTRLENIFTFDSNRQITMNLTHDAKGKYMSTSATNGLESYITTMTYDSMNVSCYTRGYLMIKNRECVPGCPKTEISSITVSGQLTFQT